MIVYNVGDKIKIKETTGSTGIRLEKGTLGIVVAVLEGRVEAAFEGLGIVSVAHNLIKKKRRKTPQLVKAKNLKLSDEVHIPGSGEYAKVANIYRDDYGSTEPTVNVETVNYNLHSYDYSALVEVRR